jgi:hypothetical protein
MSAGAPRRTPEGNLALEYANKERDEAKRQMRRWMAAFARYGGHDAGCRATDVVDSEGLCSCGFAALLREVTA